MNLPDENVVTLKRKIVAMMDYLRMKADDCDWHAVADAAMDLRELEAALQVYEAIDRRQQQACFPTGSGGAP